MENKCVFCFGAVKMTTTDWENNNGIQGFSCEICGDYALTLEIKSSFIYEAFSQHKEKFSAYAKERTIRKLPKFIFSISKSNLNSDAIVIDLQQVISHFPTKVSEQLDRALLNMSFLTKFPGAKFAISPDSYPIFYVENKIHAQQSVEFLLTQLVEAGLVQRHESYNFHSSVQITAKGWNKIYDLQKSTKGVSDQAFIAMWFADEMDTASKKIHQAIEATNYKPMRIDDKPHNGKIDDHIIAEIRRSKFVVCDFTGHRGGVYFEAGFAMGLGLPVIWTCREDSMSQAHFDTRQYNHIVWTDENDLYEKLVNRIRATIY